MVADAGLGEDSGICVRTRAELVSDGTDAGEVSDSYGRAGSSSASADETSAVREMALADLAEGVQRCGFGGAF